MTPVRVFVDPSLLERFSREIFSTWRYILVGAGIAWRQTAVPDEHCDVAFVCDPGTSSAAVTITADPAKWARPRDLRFERLCTSGTITHPRFVGDVDGAGVLRRCDSRTEFRRDVVFDIFWLLTGQDEPQWPQYAHGFTDLSGAPLDRRRLLTVGVASQLACGIGDAIAQRTRVDAVPRWPGGKRAAAAGSHDVDYPEVVRWLEPARVLARRGVGRWREALSVATGSRHHWQFRDWLTLESALGFRSAFYFTVRQGSLAQRALGTPNPFYDVFAPHFRQLFVELRESGSEIGLHPSYSACEFDDAVEAEKARLEEAVGAEIAGSRHHYWRLLPSDPAATLRQHERAGLAYDASLSFDRHLGWRRASTWPFFPFDATLGRDLTTLQIPTGWMDDQLFGMTAFNPGDRTDLLLGLVETAASQGGCVLVDVHEYVYDEALFPGWAETYRRLFEHLVQRGDFWIATPAAIAQHWRQRDEDIRKQSAGLGLPETIRAPLQHRQRQDQEVIGAQRPWHATTTESSSDSTQA